MSLPMKNGTDIETVDETNNKHIAPVKNGKNQIISVFDLIPIELSWIGLLRLDWISQSRSIQNDRKRFFRL